MLEHVFYDYIDTQSKEHAQAVMKKLAAQHGFTILASLPQTLFDGWEFWIETPTNIVWPKPIRILGWTEPPII